MKLITGMLVGLLMVPLLGGCVISIGGKCKSPCKPCRTIECSN